MTTYTVKLDNGERAEATIEASSLGDAMSKATEWARAGDRSRVKPGDQVQVDVIGDPQDPSDCERAYVTIT
jgi:hypothetical protein